MHSSTGPWACAPGPPCMPRASTTRDAAVGAPRLSSGAPWHGSGSPDLAVRWRAYVHRFDLEQALRVGKKTLSGKTPRIRHLEQTDRWT